MINFRCLIFLLLGIMLGINLNAKSYCVTSSSLNIRAEAHSNSKIIGKLVRGEHIDVLSTKGEWALVKYSSQDAYINLKYISPVPESTTSKSSPPSIYQLKISGYDFTSWAFFSLVVYAFIGAVLLFLNTKIDDINANTLYNIILLSVLLLTSLTIISIVYGSINHYLSIGELGFWKIVLWIILFAIIGFSFYYCLYFGFYQWLAYNANYCDYRVSSYPLYFALIAYAVGWLSGVRKFHGNIFLVKENLLLQNSVWDFIFAIAVVSVIIGFVVQIIFFFIRLKDNPLYLLVAIPTYIISFIAIVLSSPVLVPCMLILRFLPPAFEAAQESSWEREQHRERERCCSNCKYNRRDICSQTTDSSFEKCDNHRYIYEH